MRKPKNQSNSNNLRPIFLLIVFVVALFAASFLYKVSGLINDSKFDGNNRFTVIVFGETDNNKIDTVSFFSVDPRTKTSSILTFKHVPKIDSVDLFSIGIPVDGRIQTRQQIHGENINSFLLQLVIRPKSTNLTSIDLFRLFLQSRASSNAVEELEISWPLDESKINLTEDLFLDQIMVKEKLTIQIVNATGETGVGSLFARIITHLGGNVVSVTTSDNQAAYSEMSFIGEKTYTQRKLEQLFNYRVMERKKEAIADIIIVLGKDFKNVFH